jgi:hypothetical protein
MDGRPSSPPLLLCFCRLLFFSARMAPSANTLSFPPLLAQHQWKGASQGRLFPGSQHTWKKALAPRPLHHMPDHGTVQDLQASTGARFNLLQQTVNLPQELITEGGQYAGTSTGGAASRGRSGTGGGSRRKMPLYEEAWPSTTPPEFSVFDYCKRVGHAPPPNSIPAPRVNDMKAWFATYGHPTPNAAPGVRSEFAATTRCVLHGDGEPSRNVKMFRGRVLK